MLGYGVHGVIGVNSCFCCDLGQHGLSKVGTYLVATVVVSRNLTILLYYITYLPDSHSQAAEEEIRGREKGEREWGYKALPMGRLIYDPWECWHMNVSWAKHPLRTPRL